MFLRINPNYEIDTAHCYEDAFNALMNNTYDLLIVDIYFKGSVLTGIDLCRNIRTFSEHVPVIVLTSSASLKDMDLAFSHKIHDYIHKPFDIRHLMIRAKRWLNQETKHQQLNYKDLRFDPKANSFFYREKALSLSPKTKGLLKLFLENPETLLTPDFILEKIWGDYYAQSRNLRSYIHLLRDAMGPECKHFIHTIRGEGYILSQNNDHHSS